MIVEFINVIFVSQQTKEVRAHLLEDIHVFGAGDWSSAIEPPAEAEADKDHHAR